MDGWHTAGPLSTLVKNNLQLPVDSSEAQQIGQMMLTALENNALFMSCALPRRVLPPRFNCHQTGHSYGLHVDAAEQGRLLFEPDQSVQQLSRELGNGHASVLQLSGVYHTGCANGRTSDLSVCALGRAAQGLCAPGCLGLVPTLTPQFEKPYQLSR